MTTANSGRQIISLNGDCWRLVQASPETGFPLAQQRRRATETQFLPATVPGDIRLDLVRAGRLPDLHFGQNSLAGQWVDDHDWWLIRDLDTLDFPLGRRVFLQLRGVDYVSDVYFDEHHLGRREGMFSPQLYEITELLAHSSDKGVNVNGTLAVRIVGAARLSALQGERVDRLTQWRDRLEGRFNVPNRWPHRRSVLKCQMGFGWDFAPDLPSLGIWDDVQLLITGDVFIGGLWVRPVFSDSAGGAVRLDVTLDLDAAGHSEVEIGLNLYGLNCDAQPQLELFPTAVHPGRQQLELSIEVPEPRLWWPWDRGDPNLYRLLVTVRRRAELLDGLSQTIGLRQIRLEPNPDAPPDVLPWVFTVNGQRVFLRGANWVPISLFPGQVSADDYRAQLDLVRQANMNALRVWGGGLREKAAFYDHCDRIGLLLWQEFPLACAFLTRHPRSRDYLALVAEEARAIVRSLRHHPSVVLWCGGNEFNPARDRPVVEVLANVVAADDSPRPFVPVSPVAGDRHDWRVWHGFAPPGAYRQEAPQFASEFGLQAPPVAETLRRFIPEDELWPPGPSWTHHNADWPKLWRYAAPFLNDRDSPDQVSLDEFILASQRAQAYGLQIAIEHHRRRKYACGGSLLWQFNTPWPTIEWAILDYFRHPKLAYDVVQRLYAPVLVSLEFPLFDYGEGSEFSPSVWIINDWQKPFLDCHLQITLETASGAPLEKFQRTLNLNADCSEIAAHFSWTLPSGLRDPRRSGLGLWVRCRLYQGEELLSFNEYDLSVHDSGRPDLWRRLRSWLTDRSLG